MKLKMAALICLFMPLVAFSQLTGLDLLNRCNVALKVWDKQSGWATSMDAGTTGDCLGYVWGVLGGVTPFIKSCIPSSVTNEQAVRIVVKYLNNNPDKLNEYAPLTVMVATTEAFRCPQAKKQKK